MGGPAFWLGITWNQKQDSGGFVRNWGDGSGEMVPSNRVERDDRERGRGRGANSSSQPGTYDSSRIFTAGGIFVPFEGLGASEASRAGTARLITGANKLGKFLANGD